MPEANESLGRLTLRYTALRLGVFAACFGLGCAVMLPLNGASGPTFAKAGLIAAVLSLPIAFVLGRDLRAGIALALERQRATSRARAESDAARVAAARVRRQAGQAGPVVEGEPAPEP